MFRFDTGQSWFKDGWKAWVSYTIKNAPADLNVKGFTEKVMITANVEFIVDENGYMVMHKVIKSSGHKTMDNDAFRSLPIALPGRMRFNIIIS